MCGITGYFTKNENNLSFIKLMNDKIAHRGPDGEGFLIGGDYVGENELSNSVFIEAPVKFALAHRRLSIVDLSSLGSQPMKYLEDRYWIVYNGEIYNYLELREQLGLKGYSFKSHTDTEMIMAAYDYWGEECVKRFNGMWAFILYDTKLQEVFISRDRFGIKPLYYYQDHENFVFGSEIKSILAYPTVVAVENKSFCSKYINDGSFEYTKETAFKNIYRFAISSSSRLKITDIFEPLKENLYWQIKPNLSKEKFDSSKAKYLAEKYYELLSDAVKLRLRSDVKVGSALSGGLDSSSIVYLINQHLKEIGNIEKQETFSTVYKSEGTEAYDESIFIDTVAKQLNVKSNKIEPIESEIPNEHTKMIYALENPPGNTLMSSWYTYKLIKATGVVVTLDGQGADEQLGGYTPYIILYWANKSLKNFISELKSFKDAGTLKNALIGLSLNISSRILGRKLTNRIAGTFLGKKVNYFQHLNERLNYDMFTHLVTLIHYGDHTSMAFSIESRMPFMDYRLVEFLSDMPACYKIHKGWTKYIARLAFDNKLPNEITWRKDKMGWPIPEKKWFTGSLKSWFEKEVKARPWNDRKDNIRSILQHGAVRHLNYSIWNKIFFNPSKSING